MPAQLQKWWKTRGQDRIDATTTLHRWQADLAGHHSKRGDAYLRKLLIHGARALVYHVGRKADPDHWLAKLIDRRNMNVAVVAQATKTTRIVCALLAHGRDFRPDYASKAPE